MPQRPNVGFQTEIEFVLPKGYLDPVGVLHRKGVMRLATAADEILPLRDPRVQQNQAYLAVIVLARVITTLGDLESIDVSVIENLYASDLDYLQRLYERLNGSDEGAANESVPATAFAASGAATGRGFRTLGEA